MTKAELEKQVAELQVKIIQQQEQIETLENKTTIEEKVADIIKDYYMQYLVRNAIFQEYRIMNCLKKIKPNRIK